MKVFFLTMWLGLGSCIMAWAQFKEVKSLTRAEGLPSNTVYCCVEDNQGYLWVCTNAGIARFDGKYFQNYTTLQGVPDNEVLQVDKELNGRIWIRSYRQEVAYFDTIKNRFINAKDDTLLRALSGSGFSRLNAMTNGGMRYFFNKSTLVFKNNERTLYSHPDKNNAFLYLGDIGDNACVGLGGQRIYDHRRQRIDYASMLYLIQNKEVVDSQYICTGSLDYTIIHNGKAYILNARASKLIILSDIKGSPLHCRIDSMNLRNPSHNVNICTNYITAINDLGSADIYDIRNGKYVFTLSGHFSINSVYEDHEGNFWVSTRNDGLIYVKKTIITDLHFQWEDRDHRLYSFCKGEGGRYYIGLDDNSVLAYHQSKSRKYSIGRGKNPGNVNYLNYIHNKVYAFSEHSGKIGFTKTILNPKTHLDILNYKGINMLRDSSLMLCGQGCLDWMDTHTDSIYSNQHDILLNVCAGLTRDFIYTGSTDGLRYSIHNSVPKRLPCKDSILFERITDLHMAPDSTLWVATSQNGIYSFKNNTVGLGIRAADGLMDDMVNKIFTDTYGQVWVATNKGISLIRRQNGSLRYQIQNITQLDGLSSNEVNQFYQEGDSMFVVTSKGISILPLNIQMPVYHIPIRITGVSVNQKPKGIYDIYQLGFQENNIVLEIAGVEISGHFRQAEYTLDGGTNWILLEGRSLNLKLNSGRHELLLRSIDVNGNRGADIRKLVFSVATPFWKSMWFWIALAVALQISLGLIIYQRTKFKQKQKVEQDKARMELASLEQQAFTSLLNPHFIFNALNGLQHFINTADRQLANKYLSKLSTLIRTTFDLAQQAFISLEEELENLENYLQLEQQRHTPTFAYSLNVDKELDTEHEIMIPSMLLHPLLENAVLHVRLAFGEVVRLSIRVTRVPSGVQYEVCDNGIGLEESKRRNEGRPHRSRGLILLEKRLAALSELCGEEIKFIYDIPYPHSERPGHRVKFIIPDNLYEIWKLNQKP